MRRHRHLVLVPTPPPDVQVITVYAACCWPTVVLHDGQVQAVHHEDDHYPDDDGIAWELYTRGLTGTPLVE